MGTLYFAPAGTTFDGEWTPLGVTDDCGFCPRDEDRSTVATSFGGRTASSTLPIGGMPAATYWLLFRLRHPNVTRLRSAYRRRSKARHRRR